jgi:autotransporter-associated beta strand protein
MAEICDQSDEPFARPTMKFTLVSLTILATIGISTPESASGQVVLNYNFKVGSAVPDGGELLDARTVVGDNGPIARAEVSVDLGPVVAGDGFNGDLYLSLGHVDKLAVLLNRPGIVTAGQLGYSDTEGMAVTFSDGAANGDIHVYRETLNGNASTPLSGPLTGTWEPDGRLIDPHNVEQTTPRPAVLSVMDLLTTQDEYRLLVADASLGSAHLLRSWALHLDLSGSYTGPLNLFDTEVTVRDAVPRMVPNPVNLGGGVAFGGSQSFSFNGALRLLGSQTLQVANSTTFNGSVGETGGAATLTKAGPGTLTLAAPGTYSGGTEVTAGRLVVNNVSGSGTGSGAVLVRNGAEISGTGSISGGLTLESGAILRPGNAAGALTVGSTLWKGGAIYVWEINDADGSAGASSGWDQLKVAGGLTLSATAENPFLLNLVSLAPGGQAGPVFSFDSQKSYQWTIATTGAGIAGFDPSKVAINPTGFTGSDPSQFHLVVQGNNLVLAYAVPEPSTGILAMAGAAGLFWGRSRRSRLVE